MINITNMKNYFAYGSNMDTEQMLMRCPQSIIQKKAVLSGYEFFIKKRGYANIRQNKQKVVHGIIYKITEDDESKLDDYEGVQYGTDTKPTSAELNAYYYLATETNEGQPKKGYLENIIEAAQAHNFPKEYIAELGRWLK